MAFFIHSSDYSIVCQRSRNYLHVWSLSPSIVYLNDPPLIKAPISRWGYWANGLQLTGNVWKEACGRVLIVRVHKGVPDIRAHSEWAVAADHSVGGGGGGGGARSDADRRWYKASIVCVSFRLSWFVYIFVAMFGCDAWGSWTARIY